MEAERKRERIEQAGQEKVKGETETLVIEHLLIHTKASGQFLLLASPCPWPVPACPLSGTMK